MKDERRWAVKDKECPQFGLHNSETAQLCDCSYDFDKQASGPARTASAFRQVLVFVAGIIFLLEAGLFSLISLIQVWSFYSSPAAFMQQGTDLRLMAVGNISVSLIQIGIVLLLFRRSRRGYSWGVTVAGWFLVFLPLTQGFSGPSILLSAGYAIIVISLCLSREQFVPGGTERSPQPSGFAAGAC